MTKTEQNQYLIGTEEYAEEQAKLWGKVRPRLTILEGEVLNITFTKWELVEKEVFKFGSTDEKELKVVLNSELEVDGKDFYLDTSSTRFISAVKHYLADKNYLDGAVTLRIKRIGEGSAVQYDVEERK